MSDQPDALAARIAHEQELATFYDTTRVDWQRLDAAGKAIAYLRALAAARQREAPDHAELITEIDRIEAGAVNLMWSEIEELLARCRAALDAK
jgi:hypothetical protein